MASVTQFIQDELQVIQGQIGDTSAAIKPIAPLSDMEKQTWLMEKA